MDLIGPLFCKVCNVAIPHENARESHNQGKRHQLALHIAYMEDRNQHASVFCRGWPNAVRKEKILEFMQSFGEVDTHYLAADNSFMIIRYKESKVAQELIQKKRLKFYGRNIFMTEKKHSQKQVTPLLPPPIQIFDPILKIIYNQKSFEDEISTLVNILQADVQVDVQKYLHLCEDLQNGLQSFFPNAKVHPFGSTITGLAFRDSDVDAYIHVPNAPHTIAAKPFHIVAVNKAKDCLVANPNFANLVSIPRAKTPIVKCVHKPTGIKCDFNFKNMLGVCNSYFIQFVTRADPKLRLSLFVIKFWAKIRSLTEGNTRFTNYALTMMFIYYMQQEPFYFPPIVRLQENLTVLNLQDGWNGGFDRNFPLNLTAIQKCDNYDLLLGFFKFYSEFDYNKCVMCPYLGKTLDKTCFTQIENVPADFERYKANFKGEHLKTETPICIQDPFEHNRNLTGAINIKFLEEFIVEVKRAFAIFDGRAPHLIYNLCNEEFKTGSQHVLRAKMPKQKDLLFLTGTLKESVQHPDALYQLKLTWFEEIQKFVIEVLKDVYKFELDIGGDGEQQSKKMRANNDALNTFLDKHEIKGQCKYNLWDARSVIRDDIKFSEQSVTNLDRQVDISNYILSVLLKDVVSPRPIINLVVSMEFYVVDTHVKISLDSMENLLDDNHYYESFALCFCKTFPFWLSLHYKDRSGALAIEEKDNIGNITDSGAKFKQT